MQYAVKQVPYGTVIGHRFGEMHCHKMDFNGILQLGARNMAKVELHDFVCRNAKRSE